MSLHDNGYIFKPHEHPLMAGSPSSPEHTKARKIAYLLIGILLIVCSGLQNGLLTASIAEVRGELALDVMQGVWIQSAYLMGNAVVGVLWLKIRQHYSLQKFVRWTLLLMLFSNVAQVLTHRFEVELLARVIMGIGTSGLLTLGMFYTMQTLRGKGTILALGLSAGLMQVVSLWCYLLVPTLLVDGNVDAVFVLQLGAVLLCLSAVLYLPLPKGYHEPSLTWRDWLDFALFAVGLSLLCAYLSLGNVLWWTTDWLGYLLAFGVLFVGLALWLEAGRDKPLINWQWISARQIVFFLLMAMMTRLFTTEQNVGAGGVLNLMGFSNAQLNTYYTVIGVSAFLGLILSVLTMKVSDIRRNTLIATFGFALGAYWDIGVNAQTPVSHFYASQAVIAFATFYFSGPVLLEGMVRAIASGLEHIASFLAVFSATQVLGGLLGNAIFGAYVQVQTQNHLHNLLANIVIGNGTITAQNIGQAVQFAQIEARILAYNDLFLAIFVTASVGFACVFVMWAYNRYHKIDVIEQEMAVIAKLLAKN